MNDKTRQNQIAAFTQQTMDSLVRTQLDWSRATNDYDPDNESFRIYLPGFDPIVLKVPYAEAPEFDRKFSSLKIAGMNYAINARTNKFAFVHLSLADTVSANRHNKRSLTLILNVSILISPQAQWQWQDP